MESCVFTASMVNLGWFFSSSFTSSSSLITGILVDAVAVVVAVVAAVAAVVVVTAPPTPPLPFFNDAISRCN